jgi:hypothetical protein
MRGLAKFRNRSLYSNIINDRSAPHFTTMLSRVDPYTDLDAVKCNYLPGYDDVILDPAFPVSRRSQEEIPNFMDQVAAKSQALLTQLPLALLLSVVIPIGMSAFLLNAGYQSIASQQRIKLHEEGKAGIGVSSYRIPLMVQDVQSAMEHIYEDFSGLNRNEYLPSDTEEAILHPATSTESANSSARPSPDEKSSRSKSSTESGLFKTSTSQSEFSILALSPEQFEIIDALDTLGIKKFQVHIHKHRHSHAAIICRRSGPNFDEGKVVARHWLDNGFDI